MGCGSAQNKSQKEQTKKDSPQMTPQMTPQMSPQKAEMVIDEASVNEAPINYSELAKLIDGFKQGKDLRWDINMPKIPKKIENSDNQLYILFQDIKKEVEAQESLKQEQNEINPQDEAKQKQLDMIRKRNQENAEEQKSREEKIKKGNLLMEERLKNYQIQQIEMKDDGNCLFRAISLGLFGTQDYHELLRAIAVWELSINSRGMYWYLFQDREIGFKNYCNEMSENGTWATDLAIRNLVNCLGITLHILKSTEENFLDIHYSRRDDTNLYTPYGSIDVFVTYLEPLHYNIIIQNKGTK